MQHFQTYVFFSLIVESIRRKVPLNHFYSKEAVRRCSSKQMLFSNFDRKMSVLESFFNKVAGLKAATKLFSCEYCEIFKNSFFMEHLRWLLLFTEREALTDFFSPLCNALKKCYEGTKSTFELFCENSYVVSSPICYFFANFKFIRKDGTQQKRTDYISNIMSKRHRFFTENFTIFFFQMQ